MKAFEIQEFGIENLASADRNVEKPGPGEVLVRLKAASLNYRDLRVVQGLYNPKMRRPMVPLSDGAGVVEEVGAGVTSLVKGDRVAGCFMGRWLDGCITPAGAGSALGGSVDGVLQEYRLFDEQAVVRTPAFLTDEEAAALPCAAVTAWHALFEHRQAVPGESVLIQGTGGVSVFALQLAVAAGLRAIVTSSSDAKLARVREMGASDTINYKSEPDWEKAARKLTDGQGVDHVIEVGGSGTISRSLKAVRMGGTVSVIGILSGTDAAVRPTDLLMNSLRVQGIYVGSRAMFQRLNKALELHAIKPVIDRTFAWTDIKEALRYMESQGHFGKICLRF